MTVTLLSKIAEIERLADKYLRPIINGTHDPSHCKECEGDAIWDQENEAFYCETCRDFLCNLTEWDVKEGYE